jgi:hypothetical protein
VGSCGVAAAWGEYPTPAPLALVEGVHLFGGCLFGEGAVREGLYSRLVGGTAAQPVVQASGLKSSTVLSGFQIAGATPTAAGDAAVALESRDSPGLALRSVQLAPGNGAAGAPGEGGSAGHAGGDGGSVSGRNGAPGAGGTVAACPNTNGGEGASRNDLHWYKCKEDGCSCPPLGCGCVAFDVHDGRSGHPGETGNWADGGGGHDSKAYTYCGGPSPGDGGTGKRGGNGACGEKSAPSPDRWGAFAGGAWKGGQGGRGQRGAHAGGGGGGGAGGGCDVPCGVKFCPGNFFSGQAGGGGGAGGCGGGGGEGGHMGGPSIALLLEGTSPTFRSVVVAPATGGVGGAGGPGAVGGKGGGGGHSYSDAICNGFEPNKATGSPGGPGGAGGRGGASNGGAGGNGGPAVGVALLGAELDASGLAIYAGRGGGKGSGGEGGRPGADLCNGGTGADGLPGEVADHHDYTGARPPEPEDPDRELPYPAPPPEPEPSSRSGTEHEKQPEPKELQQGRR